MPMESNPITIPKGYDDKNNKNNEKIYFIFFRHLIPPFHAKHREMNFLHVKYECYQDEEEVYGTDNY